MTLVGKRDAAQGNCLLKSLSGYRVVEELESRSIASVLGSSVLGGVPAGAKRRRVFRLIEGPVGPVGPSIAAATDGVTPAVSVSALENPITVDVTTEAGSAGAPALPARSTLGTDENEDESGVGEDGADDGRFDEDGEGEGEGEGVEEAPLTLASQPLCISSLLSSLGSSVREVSSKGSCGTEDGISALTLNRTSILISNSNLNLNPKSYPNLNPNLNPNRNSNINPHLSLKRCQWRSDSFQWC